MLEGTFGDKKRVVLASSDEFNSLSFVQVIGKQTIIEWTPAVQTTLLVDKKKIQEFYWLHQHAGRIPVRVWRGISIWCTWIRLKPKNIFQHQVCSEAVGAGVDLVSKEFSFNWDYVQSCFFSLTILTTIGLTLGPGPQDSWALPGYGNFAAETFGGRLFCLLFGMIGEEDLSKTKTNFDETCFLQGFLWCCQSLLM